jgi:hypothetical protein
LHINGIKVLGPSAAAPVRGQLRANINGAYYTVPEASDGGVAWAELGAKTHAQFAVPRSFQYEVYFEVQIRGGYAMAGAAKTLDLSGSSPKASANLPFAEDYELYLVAHGHRAKTPSAVISYSLTSSPD